MTRESSSTSKMTMGFWSCLTMIMLCGTAAASDCTTVNLTTQTEVDNYDGFCTAVDNLHIGGAAGSPPITDLTPLSIVTTVNDKLFIEEAPQLATLDGLGSVASIGSLSIYGNTVLTNISALNGITEFTGGSIYIEENPLLTQVDALGGLAGDLENLSVGDNDLLENIDGLRNLRNASGYVIIRENPALMNIDGLRGLRVLGENLTIRDNPVLMNINGIAGVQHASYLELTNNASLAECEGAGPLLDTVDHGSNSPNGSEQMPDIEKTEQTNLNGNLPGCNEVADVLADFRNPSPPNGPALFGIRGSFGEGQPADLIEMDPATGGFVRSLGDTGIAGIGGFAIDPVSGIFYAHGGGCQFGTPGLHWVNPRLGVATLIGGTGSISDMTFDPDENLLGVVSSCHNQFPGQAVLINRSDGAFIPLFTGSEPPQYIGSAGVTFAADGALLIKHGRPREIDNFPLVLSRVNPVTGAILQTINLPMETPLANVLTCDARGRLLSVQRGSFDGDSDTLFEINPATGALTALPGSVPQYENIFPVDEFNIFPGFLSAVDSNARKPPLNRSIIRRGWFPAALEAP